MLSRVLNDRPGVVSRSIARAVACAPDLVQLPRAPGQSVTHLTVPYQGRGANYRAGLAFPREVPHAHSDELFQW